MNVAVTVESVLTRKPQLLLPLHDPLQPPKSDFQSGVATSVVAVKSAKKALQPELEPLAQAMPDGTLLTVPAPLPTIVTVAVAATAIVPSGKQLQKSAKKSDKTSKYFLQS